MKGFSSYISIGKNKGFGFQKDGPSIRLNLWAVSICFALIDIEEILENLLGELRDKDKIKNLDSEVETLKAKVDGLEGEIKRLKEKNSTSHKIINKKNEEFDKSRDEVDDLEAEVSDLNDTVHENEVLVEELETQLKKTEFDLEYTEIYFNIPCKKSPSFREGLEPLTLNIR